MAIGEGGIESVEQGLALVHRACGSQTGLVVVPGPGQLLHRVGRDHLRLLGHQVDDAAGFHASVQDGAGPLEHFDIAHVSHGAHATADVILHAEAVAKSQAGGEPSQIHILPDAPGIHGAHAADVDQRLVEDEDLLINQHLLGNDLNREGRFQERRVGLGGSGGCFHAVAAIEFPDDFDYLARIGLCRLDAHCLLPGEFEGEPCAREHPGHGLLQGVAAFYPRTLHPRQGAPWMGDLEARLLRQRSQNLAHRLRGQVEVVCYLLGVGTECDQD